MEDKTEGRLFAKLLENYHLQDRLFLKQKDCSVTVSLNYKGVEMIRPEDIESKDFSEAIPDIAAKIHAIVGSLMTYGYSEDSVMESEHCKGFGLFLGEIEDDLIKISNALYGDRSINAFYGGGKFPIFPKKKEPEGDS